MGDADRTAAGTEAESAQLPQADGVANRAFAQPQQCRCLAYGQQAGGLAGGRDNGRESGWKSEGLWTKAVSKMSLSRLGTPPFGSARCP